MANYSEGVLDVKIVNILKQINTVPLDPTVGISIVQGVEEPGVSVNLAVVENSIRPHYHKVSDEIYTVLKGKGMLTVGSTTKEVSEGDVISIPKGEVHGFVNTGQEPALILFSSGPKFVPETDRFFPEE